MIGRRGIRLAALVAGSFLLANTGSAYYYYTYFNSVGAPYTPIVARFDLNTLSNNTVPFFVSSTGPSAMYPGDSFTALISQMSAAANVWNSISSSSLRQKRPAPGSLCTCTPRVRLHVGGHSRGLHVHMHNDPAGIATHPNLATLRNYLRFVYVYSSMPLSADARGSNQCLRN